MKLILNPWDAFMDPAKEFRVFVPPPAARGQLKLRISDFQVGAISQYRWYQKFPVPFNFTRAEVVCQVSEGARRTLTEIVEYSAAKLDVEMQETLLRYGFTLMSF